MKLLHLITLASTLLLTSAAWAGNNDRNINSDLTDKKADKADARAAVSEKDGADVPPELRTPRADSRMEKLRLLIVEGSKAGQLTNGEATSLGHEMARIEREEDTYKRSGKNVNQRERRDLNRDLNKLHEHVWEKTHNGAKPEQPLAN